ncbi:TRAP transporter permease, partial [Chloroflexota bacterium]
MGLLKRALVLIGDGLTAKGGPKKYTGTARKLISILAIGITLYHVVTFTQPYDQFRHVMLHTGLILTLCYLTCGVSQKKSPKMAIVDYFLATLPLVITVYLVINAETILKRATMLPFSLSPWEFVIGIVLILLLLESARRFMGLFLTLFAAAGLVYMLFGSELGGVWGHYRFTYPQVIGGLVLSINGIFSAPIIVSSTYIILFVLFGAMVQHSGAGEFFTNLAEALVGKSRGGPAKVAVLGSGFTGMISGSSVANVAITGSITIPMMKKSGIKPYFAGAVEAAASTGGIIMPPVMGGIIFLMSELIEVPYIKICIAAAIPACLYYLAVFVQVHLYSVRNRISPLDETRKKVSPWRVLKNGWQYGLPFVSLIGLLIYGYSPIWAALWSLPTVIAASWFHKETRMGIKHILMAFESAAMTMRLVMSACALCGILMFVVFYTGVGSQMASVIASFTREMLFPALLISAVVCLILGLPLSALAAYLLTVLIIIPTVVVLGVNPLAAHLFCIYFSTICQLTPPTGATFFVAAGIAGSPPFRTGWTATRLAFAAFIVPFFWIYKPALLLMGSPSEILQVVVCAVIAILLVAMA